MTLRLVRGTSTRRVTPREAHLAAVDEVTRCQRAVDLTYYAMVASDLGHLIPTVKAWKAAEAALELAMRRERAARFAARGEHLRCVT